MKFSLRKVLGETASPEESDTESCWLSVKDITSGMSSSSEGEPAAGELPTEFTSMKPGSLRAETERGRDLLDDSSLDASAGGVGQVFLIIAYLSVESLWLLLSRDLLS